MRRRWSTDHRFRSPIPDLLRRIISPTAQDCSITRAALSPPHFRQSSWTMADDCSGISVSGPGRHQSRGNERRSRLYTPGAGRSHLRVPFGHVRTQQDFRRSARLSAGQRLAQWNSNWPVAVQHEHRIDVQRLLFLGRPRQRQLLQIRWRLQQHRRNRGRVRSRMGPRNGRSRFRRRTQQFLRRLRGYRLDVPTLGIVRGLRLFQRRKPAWLRRHRRRHRFKQ